MIEGFGSDEEIFTGCIALFYYVLDGFAKLDFIVIIAGGIDMFAGESYAVGAGASVVIGGSGFSVWNADAEPIGWGFTLDDRDRS